MIVSTSDFSRSARDARDVEAAMSRTLLAASAFAAAPRAETD